MRQCISTTADITEKQADIAGILQLLMGRIKYDLMKYDETVLEREEGRGTKRQRGKTEIEIEVEMRGREGRRERRNLIKCLDLTTNALQ